MIKYPNPLFLTRDGNTGVYGTHSWNRRVERPEALIARTMSLMDDHVITCFAGVQVCEPASLWEYHYIFENRPTAPTYEEFAAAREKTMGCFILSVNFEDLSHAVRIMTRDAELVAAWRAAIEANPGYQAAAQWHADTAANLAAKRAAFERRNPEVARG